MARTKLAAARYEKGWSQEEVAERVGVTRNTISKWERGVVAPYPLHSYRLCEVYGKTAEELSLSSQVRTSRDLQEPETEPVPKQRYALTDKLFDTAYSQEAVKAPTPPPHSILYPSRSSSYQQEEILTQFSRREIQQQITFNTITIEMSYPRWMTAMETFWQLYFTGGIPVIEVCLPGLLRELIAATSESSKMQKQIMALASQAYQMYWLLSLQRQDFGQALLAIDQAYTYSQDAQDANLNLASLVRKAHVYFHLKNPVKQLSIHEQAIQYVDSASPLMRSWFYLLLAENHASLRHQKEAISFLDLSHKVLPDIPTQDEAFSYVRMNDYLISNFEIISRLHLHQPRKALNTLEHLGLSETDPRCSELLNHRLTALYLLNNMDEMHRQFLLAVKVANQTKSILRYHELCGIYCKMIDRWPQERKVRDLEGLLHV